MKSSQFTRRSSQLPRFIFFGGKGGVGKTTCAAAWAIQEAASGRRTLVVSTDPAHSLADALDTPVSSRVSRIRLGRRAFDALELDGPGAYARWLRDNRHALGQALEHGTWLDRDDIDALLQLPVPGIDELVALVEIVRIGTPRYDTVVVDTAPTGHALRLLAAPRTVAAVAGALDALQREHRLIREQLARVVRPEAADRLVTMLADQAVRTGELLRRPDRAVLHWVLLPEALSLAESKDGLRALRRARIHVPSVIVNRVLGDDWSCPICERRRAAEHEVIAAIPRQLAPCPAVRIVRAEREEPRGVAALARIGRELARTTGTANPKIRPTAASANLKVRSPGVSAAKATGVAQAFRLAFSASEDEPSAAPETVEAFQGAQLLFFGGKGGVGKTTAAAATAIRVARADPARRVLLISTDPAHSLGDVFGAPVRNRAGAVARGPRNLHVRELDAAAALAARRHDLESAMREIAEALGSGGQVAGDRGVNELMELAPPGIDELFGILEVSELLGGRYDVVIVDTAPTGHALRLLEVPDAARDWVQVLLRVLLKYRSLVRPGQLAAELVQLSKSIRTLRERLRDRRATRFVVVTRAAAVPRLETVRLMDRLRRLKLAVPAVIVNALTRAPGRCPWCRATAAAEKKEVAALVRACRRGSRECAIILTPLAAPPPRGIAALEQWASRWQPTSTV